MLFFIKNGSDSISTIDVLELIPSAGERRDALNLIFVKIGYFSE